MTTSTSTITSNKSTFLRSQIRLLSSPLHPSPTWQDPPAPTDSSTTPLPAPALDEILTKVSAKIKSHNRLVFSAQSQRHVAEQIDALYWAELEAQGPLEQDTVYVLRDADLSETRTVAGLGATLDELGGESGPEQRDAFRELRGLLEEKTARRDELRSKVEGYRGLRKVLSAFEGEGVQRNLVTRDGELAVELERLKVLVARVVAGIERGGRAVGSGVGETGGQRKTMVVMDEQQRLQRVMDLD